MPQRQVKRIKAPPLEGAHSLLESTRQEWRSWFRDGWASAAGWGDPQVREARELLGLIDLYARSEDVHVKIELAKAIRDGRRSIGVFGPSPLQDEREELRRPDRRDTAVV